MAKHTFYIDFYPGLNVSQYGLSATTIPAKKLDGTKRISFDVTIPDELIYDIDGYASEVTKPKLTDDV